MRLNSNTKLRNIKNRPKAFKAPHMTRKFMRNDYYKTNFMTLPRFNDPGIDERIDML